MRDTLSVLDQLIGGSDGKVDYEQAIGLLGFTDISLLDQCVDAIAARDGAACFEVVQRVVSSGHDPRRFVEDLLQRLRDLLILAVAGGSGAGGFRFAAGGSAGADAGAGARFGCWTVVSLRGYVCCCFGHHGGGY